VIFIDSREPKTVQLELSAAVLGDASVRVLETADVLMFDRLGHAVGIERKTLSDLLGSLGKRWGNQITRLSRDIDHPIVVVEGVYHLTPEGFIAIGKRVTGWRHNAMQMMLWSAQRQGVTILWTTDKPGVADIVRTVHNRCLREKGCVVPGGEIQ